jgi:hypothetical protein
MSHDHTSERQGAGQSDRERNRSLRKFGLTMAVPLAVIGAVLLWRENPSWVYPMGLSCSFLLFALAYPPVLAPIEKAWMAFGRVMSVIMTHIVLTVTFYAVMTPIGLLMRLFGKDPMARRPDRSVTSYWIPVDPDGPAARPDKPF